MVIRGKSVWASVDPAIGEAVFLVQNARGLWIPFSGCNAATPASAAITDSPNFTVSLDAGQIGVGALLSRVRSVLGRKFSPVVERRTGLHNYERSLEFSNRIKAFFCFGGACQRGTALVSLSGTACALILDWPALVALCRDELPGKITRWDGAMGGWLAQKRVPLNDIQEMGGWETAAKVPRYAHPSPAHLAHRAEVLNGLIGRNSAQSPTSKSVCP